MDPTEKPKWPDWNAPPYNCNPNIPAKCNGCGQPLYLVNLFVDDGCPCNTPRGVNFKPKPCDLCKMDQCVKPGHRLEELWGIGIKAVIA